eukprot:TRINITY_DN3391_c0_g1_i7.p1 TRINITY_DN3391_c0_g1~~TRINITY_DN3391_c0_g1_i7.p1  ORF type:complete len:167 (-),score=26.95 TRINITY_DN3391_c0_g1_i7:63-563(-)
MPVHVELHQQVLVLLGLLLLHAHGPVVLGQEVSELLVGRLLEDSLLPQVWGQIGVGGGDSSIGGLGKVTQSSSGALGRGVAIINTGHLQQLLGDRGGDDASTTGGWDQSHPDRAALASHLAGDVWGLPILVPQNPLLTGMMESLAMMMAPRMAVATSLEHFTPRPT